MIAPRTFKLNEREKHRSKRSAPREKALCDKRYPASRRAALWGWSVVRCGVVLLCLVLAVAGCSPGPQAGVELPSATVSTTAEADLSEAERPPDGPGTGGGEDGQQHDEDWPRPPLAGMWVDHPERMSPSHGWLHAVISIQPPCVYLNNVSREFVDDSLAKWEGRRLALSLRYPEVRFDEDSLTLWNPLWEYDIPISHGDRVIVSSDPLLETIGDKEPHELHHFWDVCPAHALARPEGLWTSVEWLCSNRPAKWVWHEGQELEGICVEDTRPWNQRELLEQQGFAPVVEPTAASLESREPPPVAELPPPLLHGAYPYHPEMELDLAKLIGILSIEAAPRNYDSERECVYLYPTSASAHQTVLWGDSWKYTDPDGRPLAVRLDLPYPQVRFDEGTRTLWNGDIGPMTTGDRVIVASMAPPDFNNNGYDDAKQPHETLIGDPCNKSNARTTVLELQTVEHYCTHNTPARHQSQCEQAMSLRHQPQAHLTPPSEPQQ